MPKKKERKFTKLTFKINGKIYRRTVSYKTLSELADKKAQIEKELLNENSDKFSDVADRWQEEHDSQIQTYTRSCYQAPLKDLKEEFGEYAIKDITSIMFQAFLEKMVKRGFAKQTVNLRKIVMKQIFDYAIFNGFIIYNPITVCKVPKGAKRTTRELPSDTDIEIIKSNKEGLFGLYCNLMLYTGLRREEALALEYEDINFKNNTISVTKALIFEGNKPYIRHGLKSASGTRIVPLLTPLKNLLENNKKKGLIFASSDGTPITKGEFDKGFNKYKKETGICCTSHQLRHYFATICFDANLDEKDVQDIMGHAKISLTKDIYTHIRKSRKEESFKKLNTFLSENNSNLAT